MILIVEHDPDTRDRLAAFARGVGCCAVTATDGVTGLAELLGGATPCVVLIDLDAPRVEGEGFVDRIREACPGEDLCVVSVSAGGGGELAPPVVERHLTRPFTLDVLWPLIERRCRAAIRIEADVTAVRVEADA